VVPSHLPRHRDHAAPGQCYHHQHPHTPHSNRRAHSQVRTTPFLMKKGPSMQSALRSPLSRSTVSRMVHRRIDTVMPPGQPKKGHLPPPPSPLLVVLPYRDVLGALRGLTELLYRDAFTPPPPPSSLPPLPPPLLTCLVVCGIEALGAMCHACAATLYTDPTTATHVRPHQHSPHATYL
jgi:hypothetical protein